MEKIKEKPALSERVKEKAVSAPKELLRKVLDDGSERLRTQLRDTAQQGRRDEYGGDAIEDTAASGLHRAEKELLKQRKQKNTEQSASPQGDASASSSNSDVPPVIRTRETDAGRGEGKSALTASARAGTAGGYEAGSQDEECLYQYTAENGYDGRTGAAAAGSAGVHSRAGSQSVPPAGAAQAGRAAVPAPG